MFKNKETYKIGDILYHDEDIKFDQIIGDGKWDNPTWWTKTNQNPCGRLYIYIIVDIISINDSMLKKYVCYWYQNKKVYTGYFTRINLVSKLDEDGIQEIT